MSLDDEIKQASIDYSRIVSPHSSWTARNARISYTAGANFVKDKHAWIDINEKLPPTCKFVDTKYKNTYAYLFHLENGEFDNCNYTPQYWRNIIND